MSIQRFCLVLLVAMSTGCKIQVNVPPGGTVSTDSGAYECDTLQTCEIDVVDTFFSETFKGEAEEGYFFHEWRKDKKHFCGGKGTACELYTSGFAGNDLLMAILDVLHFPDSLSLLLGDAVRG